MVGFQQENKINHPDLNTRLLHFGKILPRKRLGVSHTVALAFAFKSFLRQKKKNYGNSNILPCKNIIFKKFL
jgi:hypothetical protein